MKRLNILATLALVLSIGGCTGAPGLQTLGLQNDPEASTKALLVSMGLVVDGVAAWRATPECRDGGPRPCWKPELYADAKLKVNEALATARLVVSGQRSALAGGLIFALTQASLVKVIAEDRVAPTDPALYPNADAIAYVDAIDKGVFLITTADQRVRDAYGVNTTVGELMAGLQSKVEALP